MSETILTRIDRLIAEAVRAGRYRSPADFLDQAGLSSGYLAEFRGRLEENPAATLRADTLAKIARGLGVTVSTITSREDTGPRVLDRFEGRAYAVDAARALGLPEAAIQLVLREDPGRDPGRMYWFRRIEAEAERVRPATETSG